MLITIVPIGNSKGIRIPKSILEQCKITDKVELEVKNHEIIIKPLKNKVREHWAEAFKGMSVTHEDQLLTDDGIDPETFDWEW